MRADLERFAERWIGPCQVEKDWSWGHGGSWVLELRDASGLRWYAKRHAHAEQYSRELRVYRRWVPALGEHAPRLSAYDDRLRALLLTSVPGVLMAGDEVAGQNAPAVQADLHRQAGVLLRCLHDAGPLQPSDGFVAEKEAELEAWTVKGDDLFGRRELGFVRSQLRSLAALPEPVLVPCHRDYTPRNWLVDGDRLSVIDFEWAGPEVWVNDLARLYFGVWQGRPDLRDAFLDGYGRRPDADDLAFMRACYAGRAVWMAIWAQHHGETAFAAGLRETLHDLMRHSETAGR